MSWDKGQELKPLNKPEITREHLHAYAEASGDKNPVHMDDDFAFIRGRVHHDDRTLLTADGVYKLLGPYRNQEAAA